MEYDITDRTQDNDEWLLWAISASVAAFFLANYFILAVSRLAAVYQLPALFVTACGLLALPVFMLSAVLLVAFVKRKFRELLKVARFRHWKFYYIPEGVALQLIMFVPLTAISAFIMFVLLLLKPFFPGIVSLLLTSSNAVRSFCLNADWTTFSIFVFAAVVVAPVAEEILFRGVLFTCIDRYLGRYPAVIGSSLLFALCHFNFVQFIPLFILGMVFQLLYIYHKSLFPGIIYHAVNNGVSVLILAFLKSGWSLS